MFPQQLNFTPVVSNPLRPEEQLNGDAPRQRGPGDFWSAELPDGSYLLVGPKGMTQVRLEVPKRRRTKKAAQKAAQKGEPVGGAVK